MALVGQGISIALLAAAIVGIIGLWLMLKKHEAWLHSEAERSLAETE